MNAIISSIIGLAGVLIGVIPALLSSYKTRALMEFRLDALTKQVQKHNELIERTYALEKKVDMEEAEINRHKERLNILEHSDVGR